MKTNKIEPEWYKRLQGRGFTADTIFSEGQHEDLKTILLEFGGEAVVLPKIEPDKEIIINRGQVFDEFYPRCRIPMFAGKCHNNVAKLHRQRGYRIATGYALSADGVWRQHSWALAHDDVICETTEPRVGYFGVVLNEAEAKSFEESN